jgi:FkbM family methyltransferase
MKVSQTAVIPFLKRLLPSEWSNALKRRLFVVRDMRSRLESLRKAGFRPTAVIDGGAYRGDWTRELWAVWPCVPVVLVEPQPSCSSALVLFAAAVPGSEVVPEALSSSPGNVNFRLGESNSAICENGTAATVISVPSTTLDLLLAERPSLRPNLLKLDLQGFELEALRGATQTMNIFEVIILEVSILRIGDVPIFHEVIEFMEAAGLRLYDIIPQYYRPLDGALWQVDAFFVRQDSHLIDSREWGQSRLNVGERRLGGRS